VANATYEIPNFLGGEISQFAQGRFDRPDYRFSLNVCLNSFPLEIGAWARRPGTMYGGHTRAGAKGRTVKFDFEQAASVSLEFTDGKLRFRSGATLITGNDTQAVIAVSAANPAVVQTTSAVSWATGDTLIFPGASTPLLENRQFTATMIDTTHFSLADALTGAAIDGSTLGALVAATVARVQELTTVYASGAWGSVRAVQAETTDVLLNGAFPPQALTTTVPTSGLNPAFSITPAVFNDGPYLDPFTNGVLATPGSTSGLVNLTLAFSAWSATTAYAKGSFVTYLSNNYKSLSDQNVGNTPTTSPLFWVSTTAAAAINDGRGFLATDTGRLVRLLSEPPVFNPLTTYSAGSSSVVTYNPSGVPGASTYWQAKATTTGSAPGADLTNWALVPSGAAVWTWGKITGLSNVIDRQMAGSSSIGDMTGFNGITAPFDGQFVKSTSQCANKAGGGGTIPAGTTLALSGFVGKNYTASPQKIQQAAIYPPTDNGFGFGSYVHGGVTLGITQFYTLNLRAKLTAPASESDGTLLGTVSFSGSSPTVTIVSNDQATAWNYVWVELIFSGVATGSSGPFSPPITSYSLDIEIAQISFFSPTTPSVSSAGCTVEILGPALLYGNAIATWRMGAYSDTTGYPTCGCYDDGRLWLGGAISNRFDASTSNGIVPGSSVVNFAPTDQYGVVAPSNAISETINADSVNPLFWMVPDLQGVLIGTQAGEFLILAPTSGSIAPNNITSRRTTNIGSSNIEPRRTEHTLTFVKRFGRKLMEYFADVYSGKFSAPNLAERAQHIPRAGIAELAYTEAVTPIIWGRNNDNSLFGITYKRDALTTSQGPTYAAWHRHALGSGRAVESLCSGPSVGGDLDSLTMVTNDAATNIRHVEVMTDTPDELTDLSDCWFLDDAVNPTSVSSSATPVTGAPFGGATINGLWHLNGKTIQIFAGGIDCGDRGDNKQTFTDFLVTNGSAFVPFGDSISAGPGQGQFTQVFFAGLSLGQIVAGFTYNSDGQHVRKNEPAETGVRNGPALGKLRRVHRYAMLLSNTKGLSVGATFAKMYPALFRLADGKTAIGTLDTFSGIHQDALKCDFDYDGMMCWRVSRPFPATIAAIAGNVAASDQ
jgi:hypothetical protein